MKREKKVIDISKFTPNNYGTIIQAYRVVGENANDENHTYLLEVDVFEGKLCFKFMGEPQNPSNYEFKRIFSLKKDHKCMYGDCFVTASRTHDDKVICARHHNVIKNDVKYKITDSLYRFNSKDEYAELLQILEDPFIDNPQDACDKGFICLSYHHDEFEGYRTGYIIKADWVKDVIQKENDYVEEEVRGE